MNTQIGKEEYSPYFKLEVIGDPSVEVAPSIIIAPNDTQIVRDQTVTYLDCIANARYVSISIYINFYQIINDLKYLPKSLNGLNLQQEETIACLFSKKFG